MGFTIEQWLSFLWEWVYPQDVGVFARLFAVGYAAFFPLFALRGRSFWAIPVISIWIGIQSILFATSNPHAFNFPYGQFYYFLATVPYVVTGIILARATAYPFTSLWINVGATLSRPQEKDEDFSIIDSAKRFMLRTVIFVVTLAITPILFLTSKEWVGNRYKSQSLETFASKIQGANPLSRSAISNAGSFLWWLLVTFFFVGMSIVFWKTFTAWLQEFAAKEWKANHLTLLLSFLLVADVFTLANGLAWERGARGTSPMKIAEWPRELRFQSVRLIVASTAVLLIYLAVDRELLPAAKRDAAALWLVVGSVYAIGLFFMIDDTVRKDRRPFNLPAGAIALLSVYPAWALVFQRVVPAEEFLISFAAFVLLASDYVFTKLHGEHFPVKAGRFLRDWLMHGPDRVTEQDTSLELYKPSAVAGIQIKLKRSQRTNVFGTLFFVLDVRMAVNSEDLSLIKKYQLQKAIVYDSKSRQRYEEAARGHLESSREQPALAAGTEAHFVGVAKTLYRLGRATVSTTIAALSLRITVLGLLKGIHIECKSMNELLEGENAIVTAARNVKMYLETAATFDGREEILEL